MAKRQSMVSVHNPSTIKVDIKKQNTGVDTNLKYTFMVSISVKHATIILSHGMADDRSKASSEAASALILLCAQAERELKKLSQRRG